MRVKPLKEKTRTRFLATGLVLVGLSTAAGFANPPIDSETLLIDPSLDRATVSTSAEPSGHCKRAG